MARLHRARNFRAITKQLRSKSRRSSHKFIGGFDFGGGGTHSSESIESGKKPVVDGVPTTMPAAGDNRKNEADDSPLASSAGKFHIAAYCEMQ